MIFVDEILKHLDDPKSFVVAHPSPAVRVSIAEEFERNPGDFTINKLYSAFEKAEIFRRIRYKSVRTSWNKNVYTGGATIFGNSGGVMKTALHTAYAILTGKEMKDPDITPVRGYEKDITKAVIPISLKDYGEKITEFDRF